MLIGHVFIFVPVDRNAKNENLISTTGGQVRKGAGVRDAGAADRHVRARHGRT